MATIDEIYEGLSARNRLTHLIQEFDNITIVDYAGGKSLWFKGIKKYFRENDINISRICKIISLGVEKKKRERLTERLSEIFPQAKNILYSTTWDNINPLSLPIDSPLVIHLTYALGDICNDYINHSENTKPLRNMVDQTRSLFSTVLLGTDNTPFIIVNSHLDSFRFEDNEEPIKTTYCISKEKYIKQCKNELNPHSALLQCIEEIKNGCDTCSLANNYGKTKLCPMAIHELAQLYRKDDDTSSQSLSHQLELSSARQGYAPAHIQVADNLSEGYGCEKELWNALAIYKQYAIKGNIYCSKNIVQITENEESVSEICALPWLIQQANAGDLDSAAKLSKIFADGSFGVPIDRTVSQKWQTILAESGDEKYIFELMTQAHDRHDGKESLKWARKLKELGSELLTNNAYQDIKRNYVRSLTTSPYSLYPKGRQFLYGTEEPKDIELAELCLTEAAEAGNMSAQELLCEEYYAGTNLKKDFTKSVYWGDKALMQGSKDARFRVAWLYCGEGSISPDYDKAHQLYEELAGEGNTSALNNLGWMYEYGFYYQRDSKKAFEWYLKAAERGAEFSMWNVGNCYKYGTGVEKNPKIAFSWYIKAAQLNEPHAIQEVIDCYKNGYGVEKDEQKVVEWYEKLINNGENSEMVNLGHYYETVIHDYEKALYWYRKAAENDDRVGQYNMGIMYQYGKGVDKNLDNAIYWYRKSAMQGYENAKDKLKELNADWLEQTL